ncbi:MAG TPA: P1 family peptidase [Terriglobia bacterium]|nr:P1 family peptidase [Terriglobia bacterium]
MGSICDIAGVKIGHYTDPRRPTGCTVVMVEGGAVAGVDVRGSAPGTRETDLLNPVNTVEKINAILLSGGSAFGLEAASGVMKFLEERGIGYPTGAGRVPIVPAAVLYDLNLGDPTIRPGLQAGYEACRQANPEGCQEGNFGAGAGATVGKLFGFEFGMKGGVGTVSLRAGPWLVGAIVAVNCSGDVVDPATGRILAGARSSDRKTLRGSVASIKRGEPICRPLGENTTLAVLGTNVQLNKAEVTKLAQMGQDGLARAIHPAHTHYDGDAVFALSTGEYFVGTIPRVEILTTLGILAAEAVSQAILRAVSHAKGLPNLPAHADLTEGKPDAN